MLFPTAIAAALAFGAAPSAAQPQRLDVDVAPAAAIDKTTITDDVPLSRDLVDRMTVAVSVAGRGPYNFLVDTGSERTVISRELADRLRLEEGRDVHLHSVVGASKVNTVLIPDLRVSGSALSIVDAPALDASNIGADGLLGIDSLRSKRVLFDFKAQTMSITPSSRKRERLEGDTIVVRAKSRRGRLVFTHAKIDGNRVVVIIDTGSQVTIGNPALQKSLAKRKQRFGSGAGIIETVTGETFAASVGRLRQLELGNIKIEDMEVAFADAHIFRQLDLRRRPALLLGMNAMRAFDRISIDFETRKVRFVLPGTTMRDQIQLAYAGGH